MNESVSESGRELTHGSPLTGSDLLCLVRSRWLIVLLFGLTTLSATCVFYCNMNKWYQAEIMIIPKRDPASSGSVRALLSRFGLSVGPPRSETERIAALLHSRSVTDGIIESFDLVRRYEVRTIEEARKRLWTLCTANVQKKPKIVLLRCEDRSPKAARDMTDAFGQLADRGLRQIAVMSARDERIFLEDRVAEAERDLDASSRELRRFREANAILDLPAQSKAAVSGLATLQGDITSKTIELSYLRGFASKREASVGRLQQQITVITAELHELEGHRAADSTRHGPRSVRSGVLPPPLEVPRLSAELDVLLREHKLRESVLRLLVRKYEAMKVREARDVSGFSIFDPAAMPTEHIRPSLRILPPGFLAGLLLGVLFISRESWLRHYRRKPRVRSEAAVDGRGT